MDYNFIGIDLGSRRGVMSHLVRQNNTVVLNGIGDRENPVAISYSDQERLFGDKALLALRSRPLSTILCPQRFLTIDQKQIQIETTHSYARMVKDNFALEGPNLQLNVSPQQALTGFLNFVQNLNKTIPQGMPTFYCVSSANHCGYRAKKEIAKCMSAVVASEPSVVSQKMAIGLDYLINISKEKQTVLFIDFGHSKISAYALKFNDESIVEMMEGSYSNLGVRSLDHQLMKHFQSLITFKLNDKARMKLRDIAAKTRTILSANSEQVINEDFGDQDFECRVTREQFEKICENAFKYVQNFLELTKKSLIERGIKINCIEMFGGGSRIPMFQKILSKVFVTPVKKTVSTEALSRGCALYAHHREKISKLGKIELKEIMKCRVKLFINHYKNQPVGQYLDPRRAENLESHILYELGTYNDDKKLAIQPRKDHGVEIWFVSEEAQEFAQYYCLNQIDKDATHLNIDISTADGYPKIRGIVAQIKNVSRNMLFEYDSRQEVDNLRAIELQFRAADVKVIEAQEKRNRVESEVFRLRATHPEVESYLEASGGMSVLELDQVLLQLSVMQ